MIRLLATVALITQTLGSGLLLMQLLMASLAFIRAVCTPALACRTPEAAQVLHYTVLLLHAFSESDDDGDCCASSVTHGTS